MRLSRLFIILPILCWAVNVGAQMPDGELSSSMPEQWQLSLDVIKSKAKTLLIQNNGLQMEYRQLIGQLEKLRQEIYSQQYKNEKVSHFLKERHGRTDQQLRLDELAQTLKAKRQQARDLGEQLNNLYRKQANLDSNIQRLKQTITDTESSQNAAMPKTLETPAKPKLTDDQLDQWRKKLESENQQEAILEDQLKNIKNGTQVKDVSVDAINKDNRQLEARLESLRFAKLRHIKKSSDVELAQANAKMYSYLKTRKYQLEAKISAYELRMDQLKESSLLALSWRLKKKKMVHDMVQADARNNQILEKIKDVHEDIDILKEQVAKLERRLNFSKGSELRK